MGKWSEFMNMFKEITTETDVRVKLSRPRGAFIDLPLPCIGSGCYNCPKLILVNEDGPKSIYRCIGGLTCWGMKNKC